MIVRLGSSPPGASLLYGHPLVGSNTRRCDSIPRRGPDLPAGVVDNCNSGTAADRAGTPQDLPEL